MTRHVSLPRAPFLPDLCGERKGSWVTLGALPLRVGVRRREQSPDASALGVGEINAPTPIPPSKPAAGLGLVSFLGFEGSGRKGWLKTVGDRGMNLPGS